MAVALSGGRVHPVFALWPVWPANALRRALLEEGVRGAGQFLARYRVAQVAFDEGERDPFFNINREESLREAERHLGA